MAKGAKEPQKPQGNGLKRLEERLSKASGRSGFPAYVRANFERLSSILEASPRGVAKWAELAKWAEDEGLVGEGGLQPNTAKRAYEREKKRRQKLAEEAALKRKLPRREQPTRVAPQVRVLAEVQQTPSPNTDPDDPIARLRREMNHRSGRKSD